MAPIDSEERACSEKNKELKNLFHKLAAIEADCAYYKCKTEEYRQDVRSLTEEVELGRLKSKWLYDSQGKRLAPSPEEEALRVTKQLVDNPETEKGVFQLLREKKTKLQTEVSVARSTMLKSEQGEHSKDPQKS